jgi:hypothetical protein
MMPSMTTKGYIALKMLLKHYHADASDEPLRFLSEEEQQRARAAPVVVGTPQNLWTSLPTLFAELHYSWLAEKLKEVPQGLQKYYLTALPENQHQPVQQILALPSFDNIPLSTFVKTFLQRSFYTFISADSILPTKILPSSPLNPLLALSKPKLVRFISYLGLHDVAADLLTILEKTAREAIYKLLTPTRVAYLEYCLRQQESLPPPNLGLRTWQGDARQFEQLCQTQGLKRLGFALSRQNRSLLWHLCHRLDTGRGKLLLKHAKDPIEESICAKISAQIESLMKQLHADQRWES